MRYVNIFLLPFALFAQLSEMSLEEKVGQLFVAPISPVHERLEEHRADWARLLNDLHIGNAIIKQSDPASQIRFLNELQSASKWPLLITADAEWGLGMRMSQTVSFPRNMTLGAIQDLELLEALGEEIGHEARLVGIHMNFAPVVDVNNNPKNPVIHMRSFGDRPEEVAKRGEALIRGMQRGGLMTCIKHFPGHGDTEVDSHFGLPTIVHDKRRLSEIELPPFKQGIAAGTDAVMTAHLIASALDPNVPATLSYPILTELLRGELQFDGLIVTDALNMRALTNFYTPESQLQNSPPQENRPFAAPLQSTSKSSIFLGGGVLQLPPEEIALAAHAAGADLLLYGSHILEEVDSLIRNAIPRAYQALLKAYQEGVFPLSRLDASVHRILSAKESLPRIIEEGPDLQTRGALDLKEALFEAAITHVGLELPPINEATAYLSNLATDSLHSSFAHSFFVSGSVSGLIEKLSDYSRVVVALQGVSKEQSAFLEELSQKTELTICLFGSPYAVDLLPSNASILIGYEEGAQKAMAKVLKKEMIPTGKLPVRIQDKT